MDAPCGREPQIINAVTRLENALVDLDKTSEELINRIGKVLSPSITGKSLCEPGNKEIKADLATRIDQSVVAAQKLIGKLQETLGRVEV